MESLNVSLAESLNVKNESNSCSLSPDTEISSGSDTQNTDICSHSFTKLWSTPLFIDKSLLLYRIVKESGRLLLIAPRRNGKSVNMHMLKTFFAFVNDEAVMIENKAYFEKMNIAKKTNFIKNHFGSYPTIYLDLKSNGRIDSVKKARDSIKLRIHEAYLEHKYLKGSLALEIYERAICEAWCHSKEYKNQDDTDLDLEQALFKLAEYLNRHHNKEILVLVDEYDNMSHDALEALMDEEEVKSVNCLVNGVLASVAKGPTYISRCIFTGISYIMSSGLSKLNNFMICRYQDETNDFGRFYGVTRKELRALLLRLKMPVELLPEIVKYYGGYANDSLNIYSVMKFLRSTDHQFIRYWNNSGMSQLFDGALKVPFIQSQILTLLNSEHNQISFFYFKNVQPSDLVNLKRVLMSSDKQVQDNDYLKQIQDHVYFTFLMEIGFLCLIKSTERTATCKVPNKEMNLEFYEKVVRHLVMKYNLNFTFVKYCAEKFDQLCDSDDENEVLLQTILEMLNRIMQNVNVDVLNEAVLHHVIFIVIHEAMKFSCFSEIHPIDKSQKRLDLLMIHNTKNLGVLLELKYDKDPHDGLEQIIGKEYFKGFDNLKFNPEKKPMDYYILMGLAMSKEKNISFSVLYNNRDLNKKKIYM